LKHLSVFKIFKDPQGFLNRKDLSILLPNASLFINYTQLNAILLFSKTALYLVVLICAILSI